ncbi:MAG TPA: hypothetical protein VMS54_13040 [Vicinamibacterales bacterium]|nr:hypothetical protein [Vicinamibacterales bacterium]
MLLIRAGVLCGALLLVAAASSDQAAPTVTVSCKAVALEALWSGSDSFTCTVKPVQQSPSAYLKVSCLAPAGVTCEVDPAMVRLSAPPQAGYVDVAVRLSYTPALAAGESPLEIVASMRDLPASATVQVVKNLNTLSSRCPSAADLQAIDRDLRLVWRSDPTAGTVACRKADGSRDLTVMQARAYRALNTMRYLSFTEPLPWTRDPVYRWFTRAVRGLDFRSDVSASSCCSADKLINIRAVVSPGPAGGQQGFMLAITSANQMPTDFRMLASFLQLLVHEARHADGKPHTCGPSDQTMEEMGAWAAAHAFQTWIADKMAPGLVPDDVRANLRQQADQICRTRICKGCNPRYPQNLSHEGVKDMKRAEGKPLDSFLGRSKKS